MRVPPRDGEGEVPSEPLSLELGSLALLECSSSHWDFPRLPPSSPHTNSME